MKNKTIALLCVLALALAMAGCGSGEETTMTGMVVSVDGTVITLVEMDSLEDMDFTDQRPAGSRGEGQGRPGGSEDFTMPEGFDPNNFDPNSFGGFGGGFDGFDGEMPEGGQWPEDGQMPQMPGGQWPEGGPMPQMPEGGGMPNFGSFGSEGSFEELGETTTIDLAEAHISVEIENGKESGDMSSIRAGSFVTITLDKKGNATYVLVSATSGLFGGYWFGN